MYAQLSAQSMLLIQFMLLLTRHPPVQERVGAGIGAGRSQQSTRCSSDRGRCAQLAEAPQAHIPNTKQLDTLHRAARCIPKRCSNFNGRTKRSAHVLGAARLRNHRAHVERERGGPSASDWRSSSSRGNGCRGCWTRADLVPKYCAAASRAATAFFFDSVLACELCLPCTVLVFACIGYCNCRYFNCPY